jgi:Spy/CpxP family protein refolding chaperone
MSNEAKWTSKLLASMGVVRAEVSPSQGVETAANRKMVLALALAATTALGAAAPENVMAGQGFDSDSILQTLIDQQNAMDKQADIIQEDPYRYRYRVPKDNEITFINKVNTAFYNLNAKQTVDLSDFESLSGNDYKMNMAKHVAKDMYDDALGNSTSARVFKGLGLFANPAGVLSEKLSSMAVATGGTALTGEKDISRSVGRAVGSGVSLAAGYALLPQVAVVSASLNTVQAGFQLAEKIEDAQQKEAHRNAQRAVDEARIRMSAIYMEERLKIREEHAARYSPEQATQAAVTSDLASSADISELLADEPSNAKADEHSGPSL